MSSFIAATATALPSHYYSQDELIAAFREMWAGRHYNLDRLEQFHRNVLVGGRHLALTIPEYSDLKGFEETNAAWTRVALELGERVLRDLLDATELPPGDVRELIFTTITGLAVPSIDARLMNRIEFSPALKRVPLFGLGCLAGAAGVARLHDYLTGHPTEAGILLSVELCSLTLQRDDVSIPNIISSGLFGDGAAAVLMTGSEHPLALRSREARARGVTRGSSESDKVEPADAIAGVPLSRLPRVIDSRSIFFPDSERVMGWDIVDTGFKIVLSSDVAPFARERLRPGLEAFLGEYNLGVRDIETWVAHPGGPKVIESMVEGLDLAPGALDLSLESLARVGNLSSASVLFVLQETLKTKSPAPGSYGILLAMGPAFCAEVVLLQWPGGGEE
ncbi:MAG: 3-oxoacyl-[acyl-carrier-protein] synthase III C-terminal domain-containing protein [Leptospirales bacterium]|jgi:alkylresorcinol/alkylpyrone synthase